MMNSLTSLKPDKLMDINDTQQWQRPLIDDRLTPYFAGQRLFHGHQAGIRKLIKE
jgi:hypothetical protein